jgi:hypothetical protein
VECIHHSGTWSALWFSVGSRRGVCCSLYYVPQTPVETNRNTIEGQRLADRLPTDAVPARTRRRLSRVCTEPRDRLRAAAVAILVVAGFRIGELLTMPLDCEAEESGMENHDTGCVITRKRFAVARNSSRLLVD